MWGLTGFQTNLAGLDSWKFQRRSRRRMLAKESSSKARSIPNKPSSLGNIWKHPKNTNDTKKHITCISQQRQHIVCSIRTTVIIQTEPHYIASF